MSQPHTPLNLNDWVGRSETLTDVADAQKATLLQGIFDTPGATLTELPPLGHWLHFTPKNPNAELGQDGHPKLGGFMPPVDLPRRMWAGSAVTFHAPIPFGSTITRVTTIESVTPKTGSQGELVFVKLRHDISANDTLARTEVQTIVYKEATPVPEGFSSQPPREYTAQPEGWEWSYDVTPDEVTLFRYSALTFNSHRIHYDLQYTSTVEGYPGLVTHGPLSATLMMHYFQLEHPDATPASFEFRAKAPVFANERLTIVGRPGSAPDVTELAVLGPTGFIALEATLTTSTTSSHA